MPSTDLCGSKEGSAAIWDDVFAQLPAMDERFDTPRPPWRHPLSLLDGGPNCLCEEARRDPPRQFSGSIFMTPGSRNECLGSWWRLSTKVCALSQPFGPANGSNANLRGQGPRAEVERRVGCDGAATRRLGKQPA
jgi:hypothetical protein